jgi:hypothetical protein
MDLLALCTMYLGKLELHKSQLVDEADFHQKESAAEPGASVLYLILCTPSVDLYFTCL